MEKGTVCVTGGAGYLASWMIKTLLEDGYSVNATWRSDPGSFYQLAFNKYVLYIFIMLTFINHIIKTKTK